MAAAVLGAIPGSGNGSPEFIANSPDLFQPPPPSFSRIPAFLGGLAEQAQYR